MNFEGMTEDEIENFMITQTRDLGERCAEVLEWDRTGILKGNALRAYADTLSERYPEEGEALRQAERMTLVEAADFVVGFAARVAPPMTDGASAVKPQI